jgi:hypothetical protein
MNLNVQYIFLFCLTLLSVTFSSNLQKLSFLEDNNNEQPYMLKLNNEYDQKVADEIITKTFQDNESVYELTTFLEMKDNEMFLVMNIKEENNLIEYYYFEGEYHKLVMYDANWKIFNDNTSIFYKLLKKVIPNNNFSINFE